MTEQREVRVRFAPSPTGHLHVGGARTAIFNWLFARHHNGRFIIRVEDTDVVRSTRESEQMVLDDLRWLGLNWDEGPEVGGPHASYRQSERTALYHVAAGELLASGLAYRCFCEEAELERKRQEAEANGRPPHYDLTCYRLSREEVEEKVANGIPSVVRFHVPHDGDHTAVPFDGDVTIDDLIRGEITWKKESLGDFIVIRSDGMPTYNFSVVIDDHEMEISHVIRAEEHLTNTQRQVLIYRAMGWTAPQFAHVSLVLGPDRSKLSKRHGATSVASYAEEGFLPEAMFNYLTLLGWSSAEGKEMFSREYAVEHFSLDRVNAAAAVFDRQKFEWLNGQYIHHSAPGYLFDLLVPNLVALGWLAADTLEARGWFEETLSLVRTAATRLHDLIPAMQFLFEFDVHSVLEQEENRALFADPSAADVVAALVEDLREHGGPADADGLQSMITRLKEKTGQKGKKLFMPVRVALTGSPHGPELQRAIPLLTLAVTTPGLASVKSPLQRAEALLEHLRP